VERTASIVVTMGSMNLIGGHSDDDYGYVEVAKVMLRDVRDLFHRLFVGGCVRTMSRKRKKTQQSGLCKTMRVGNHVFF
jgi:hypothetical protein